MTDGAVRVRKKDTSGSSRDFWKNGAGNHPYHRHDDPCDDAPTAGFVHYESDEIHDLGDVEICPNCDWSETEVARHVDAEVADAE